jgi:hypothetical protein
MLSSSFTLAIKNTEQICFADMLARRVERKYDYFEIIYFNGRFAERRAMKRGRKGW